MNAWLWELWAVDLDIVGYLYIDRVTSSYCFLMLLPSEFWTFKTHSPSPEVTADVRFPGLGTEIKKVKDFTWRNLDVENVRPRPCKNRAPTSGFPAREQKSRR